MVNILLKCLMQPVAIMLSKANHVFITYIDKIKNFVIDIKYIENVQLRAILHLSYCSSLAYLTSGGNVLLKASSFRSVPM